MRKRVFMFASLSLILTLVAGAALGASTKVLLSPKSREGPSDAFPFKGDKPHFPNALGADYLLYYDTGAEASILGGLADGDTMLVWFQSPAACTLLEIHIYPGDAGDYDVFAADAVDTIDWLNDYEEYHGGSTPGPRPIDTPWDDDPGRSTTGGWDTLDVLTRPDVGTDVFVGGYVLRSATTPQPIIDAGIDPPYHTLMERNVGGGPRGWYSSWHHVYIRALVSLYENVAPTVVSYTRLPDTYSVTGRFVTCYLTDIGVPSDSTGVGAARILYGVNNDSVFTDTVSMTLVSGTIEAGEWAGYLPPASAGDIITYSVSGVDLQGVESATNPIDYQIRVGQSTAELLFVNDDYYGAGFIYDPVDAVIPDSIWDYWDAGSYGLPDASVIHFGYKAILWNTWDGTGSYGFVADTALIAEFLDNGGALFLSSMDMPAGGFHYSWGAYTTQEGEWLHDHLHVMGGFDDWATDSISVYFGEPGDPITGDFADWPVTNFPYNWVGPGYNYGGYFVIDENDLNVSAIFYDVGDPVTGYKYDLAGSYKIVNLYWPFNYLVNLDGSADTISQDLLVANTMIWFGVDPVGITEKVRDRLRSRSNRYLLWQNWPNPAKGPTTISFNVPEPTRATLRVYDITGRVVNTLVDDHVSAGRHSLTWNGTDKFGQEVPSGVYIYRLSAGKHNMARKMVLVR